MDQGCIMKQFSSFRANATWRLSLAALFGAGLAFAMPQAASAQSVLHNNQLAAKAQPDECFVAIGSLQNGPLPCTSGGQPKVNQAYVWGLTESGSNLWFGTAANVQCLVLQGYVGITTPLQTPSYVCEFAANHTYHADWRPPQIYAYNVSSTQLVNHSADSVPLQVALGHTLGLRSAGSIDSIVFLGGPSVDNTGMYLFAFNTNGTYLGSQKFPNYLDIRQWIVTNGDLYTGVQAADGTGRVLRWTGTLDSPFQFEEVGKTDAEVAYITVQNSRLYVTTWGGGNAPCLEPGQEPSVCQRAPSGVWVSPAESTLTNSDLNNWQEVWTVNNYEVDPATAATLVGGAIESYKGKIYWGLMQVPFTGLLAHYTAYPNAPNGTADTLMALVNTTRPIPIFRSSGDPSNLKTQLLYGSKSLPFYNPVSKTWVLKANASGKSPLYGAAGFGNPFNTYTWSGNVFRNKLYFGTFDWSYLLVDGFPLIAQELGLGNINISAILAALGTTKTGYGADLWRFDGNGGPAKAENTNGLGNYLNYGIRTMVSDANHLYAGTANPMNLKTVPNQADGGWELRVLSPK